MKILYLVPDLEMGGVTTVIIKNILELKNKNCEIILVSMKIFNNYFESLDIRIISLNMRKSKDILSSLRSFDEIVNTFLPDIIHSHTYYPNMFIRVYSILYNNKTIKICNEHGTYQKGTNNLHWFLFRLTKNIPDYFLNGSIGGLDSYIDNNLCVKNKSAVLLNGIDTNKYKKERKPDIELKNKYSIKNKDFIFAYIGRLSYEKDVMNLLHSIRILSKNSNNNFILLIIGDGPEKNSLNDFVNKNRLNEIVKFIGAKSDILPYYSIIDAVVLPSKTESSPTVLIEAMAMECMVVSTDCSGVKDILHGVKSFIVPIENSEQLASKMSEVLNLSIETRRVYGKEYRERIILNYFIENTVDKIYELYFNLISKDKL